MDLCFENPPDGSCFDFHRADFEGMLEALNHTDWEHLNFTGDVDESVDHFTNVINNITADYVPLRGSNPKPVWGNAHLRHLKQLRSKALRKYSRSRSVLTKQMFNRASNRYRTYNCFLYKRYTLRMQENLRRNPKSFWKFVNSKRTDNGLPLEMFLGNDIASSASEKCNLLARHFKNAFNSTTASPAQVGIACRDTPSNVCCLGNVLVTTQNVASAIAKLKYSTSSSHDGIPSCVLKRCSDALIHPLAVLFNISLRERKFPSCWKTSIMFPVHKKGDKRNVANYRGITSLCACSKIFEIIINDMLFTSCKTYISSDQHGFYPKRSASTNLVQFTSFCLRSLDQGTQVDTVYTDLKSAFDRVDHEILLERLERLGVCSSLICWFRSYLTNRKLTVKIGNELSEPFSNPSGVPQGSNLGPLLFSIFINELTTTLPPGRRLLYADDVKIYMVVKCLQDCLVLQQLIDRFALWCTRNMLTLSINKCNVITFHRKLNPIRYNYNIGDRPLEQVCQIRDLGVILDSALTFRLHYDDIISRANRQLGFIFKIANEFRDPLCLRSLFCALVRSILEFNVVVWCPYQSTWIARIESIQRKFVRYALRYLPWRDPINLPPYEDRCRLLGIETLEKRRKTTQAVFVAKILLGDTDSSEILGQLNIYAPERILRQREFLMLESRNTLYAQHNPIRFMSAIFNQVYYLFDFNASAANFKRRLLDIQ